MTKKIALFIDADNISAKFGKQIIETLERHGEIFIRRIYGNWEKISLHSWNDCILNFSLRAIQQPDYVAGKNATDMSLLIDAMDILYGGKAEIFALVSNDSDFTPLAIRLREGGMKIIGMGNSNAANSFRMACDEFIDLDAPAEIKIHAAQKEKNPSEKISPAQMNLFAEEKLSPAPVVKNPKVISISNSKIQSERDKKIQQIHNILHEAAEIHSDADDFSLLNCAGAEIKSKNLGFSVKDLGYANLQEFVAAFPKLYSVQKDGTIARYRCLSTALKIPSDKFQQLHEILHEAASLHADSNGFVNLWWACDFIIDSEKIDRGIKSLSYRQLRGFVFKFPDLYEINCQDANNEFFYRCLSTKSKSSGNNLQQIHDILRETAKVQGDEKGFVNLGNAGNAIAQKNLSLKSLGHSKLSKFISAFPTLYELNENSYRCKK